MRNAVWRLGSSSSNNNNKRGSSVIINGNGKRNTLNSLTGFSSSDLLEKLHDRLRRHEGLSATRRGVLLRDWKHVTAPKRRTSMDCSSIPSLLSEDQLASSTSSLYRGRSSISNSSKGEELCRVLRVVSEFIASTGACGDPTFPLQHGYADLSPVDGLRRATLVLHYTYSALLLSNDLAATIMALTFGHQNSSDTELELEEQSYFNTRHALRLMRERETMTAAIEEDEDEEEREGAPLTSLEVVALLRWCTWHVRTALYGLYQEEAPTIESFHSAVQLVSRFLTRLLDGGLQRGAVENIADEDALSNMAYTVTDELLKVLNAKTTCVSHHNESSFATPVDFLENTNTTTTSVGDTDSENFSGVGTRLHDSNNGIMDDKSTFVVDRWSGLQIHEDALQALLCTQREHWERALSLLIRVRRWNDSLVKRRDVEDNKKRCKGTRGTLLHQDTLHTLVETPRAVLQTLQYIIAQHGQWSLCMELWQETVHRRSILEINSMASSSSSSSPLSPSSVQELSPFATLHHPFNVDNVVAALAFVNAKPSKTVLGSSGDSVDLPARLLRLLLYLGVVPNRALSPAEFAALLKQSFGLKLGRGGVGGILSPAYVWRLAASHPRRARATLCLMCFHIVVRNGLIHTLELEDLYVVTRISRQSLQEHYRAAEATSSLVAIRREKENGNQGSSDRDTSTSDSHSIDDNTDEYERNAFGPLPLFFAPATRRSTAATETHTVAITDAFLSIQRSMLPVKEETDMTNHTYMHNPRRPGCSAVLLSLVSRELMALLTMAPYGGALGRTWRAALAALSHDLNHTDDIPNYNRYPKHPCDSCHSYTGVALRPSRSVAVLAQALRCRALDPDGHSLIDPLVQLAPRLSAFAVGRIVYSPLGRQLTWQHCLQLLPCTPWGSWVQRHLLRRVVLESERNVAALRGLMQVKDTLPPRLLHGAPTLAADMQVLAILSEHDWRRALTAYVESGERVQQACAPHVARLVISAGVWYIPRVQSTGVAAVSVSSSSSSATSIEASSNAGDNGVDHNGRTFTSLLRVALRAVGGDRVAEEMLHGSLLRGRWAAGLAFYQFLQHDQPEILRSNTKAEMYVALLCKGLLSQTAIARAIAEVSRSARGAAWKEASETFMQYMTGGCSNGGNNKSMSGSTSHVTVDQTQEVREISMDFPLSRGWSSLFHIRVPAQLTHFAHTVRYSMLCSEFWEQALRCFPPNSLPLPLHHQLQLQRITGGVSVGMESEEDVITPQGSKGQDRRATPSKTTTRTIGEGGGEGGGATIRSPSPLSLSLVQIALQEKLHRTKAPVVKASAAAVERTLRILQERGQWEQAMLVYEHALANRCFPHTAASVLLAACLPSWEASLYCFTHLSDRMRPDAKTTALALQACAHGQQWVLALRILKQSVLTTAVAAPRVIDYAVKAALHSGAWQAALRVARNYRSSSTSNPLLANTIMHVLVTVKCWDDAVGFFYECVMCGMRPLDESLTMAITASKAVSTEYRDTARVVTVIASALEDFFHVHGVVQQHVLVVYHEISSKPYAGVGPHLTLVSFARSVSSGGGGNTGISEHT